MAAPPPRLLLTQNDAPGAPSWIAPILDRLNAFSSPTADALTHGLTFTENFACEIVTVVVTPEDDWVPLGATGAPAFGANWAQWNDANFPKCALQKSLDGWCQARGLWDFTGTGSANSTYLVTFPAKSVFAPATGKFGIHVADAYMGFGDVIVSSSGIQYLSGNTTQWTSLAPVRWRAADASQTRWKTPLTVQLGRNGHDFPGTPSYVLPLQALRVDGRPSVATVSAIDWQVVRTPPPNSGTGLRLYRLFGLESGVTYSVKLLVLAE